MKSLKLLSLAVAIALLPVAASAGPFSFAVISDTHLMKRDGAYSLYPATVRLVARITGETRPDFVIHAGDMLSLNPGADAPLARAMWAIFDRGVRDPLAAAGIPLFPTPGNHDRIGGGVAVYAEHWRGFENAGAALFDGDYAGPYAFRHAGCLFISVNGSGSRLPDADRAWLEALLARTKGRFAHTFLVLHIGLVPGVRHPAERLHGLTPEWLAGRGVDFVLCGHQHGQRVDRFGGLTHVTAPSGGETPPREGLLVTVDGPDVRFAPLAAPR